MTIPEYRAHIAAMLRDATANGDEIRAGVARGILEVVGPELIEEPIEPPSMEPIPLSPVESRALSVLRREIDLGAWPPPASAGN
jgi:hypothetical protein